MESCSSASMFLIFDGTNKLPANYGKYSGFGTVYQITSIGYYFDAGYQAIGLVSVSPGPVFTMYAAPSMSTSPKFRKQWSRKGKVGAFVAGCVLCDNSLQEVLIFTRVLLYRDVAKSLQPLRSQETSAVVGPHVKYSIYFG